MTECTQTELSFPSCKSKKVSVDFSGGNISSFGRAVLLRQADRQTGFLQDAARLIPDPRRQASVTHSVETMLRQRVFAVACGEEDLNDHDELRKDIVLQTAVGTDGEMESASTLCRFENASEQQVAFDLNVLFVEQFIASHKQAPREIILDFDADLPPWTGQVLVRVQHG